MSLHRAPISNATGNDPLSRLRFGRKFFDKFFERNRVRKSFILKRIDVIPTDAGRIVVLRPVNFG